MLAPVWKRQWRDHPLRRRVDILEAWALLALAAVLSLGAPTAGAYAARSAYAHDLVVATDQESSRRQVPAVVVRRSPPADISVGETGRGDTVRALVRWTAPEGTPARGVAQVPAGLERGERTHVWLDSRGRVTEPPLSHEQIVAGAVAIGAYTTAAGVGAAAAAGLTVRRVAGRRRMAEWEREWQWVGPSWRRHDA
ncbi:hypothetical protein ACFT7S_19600 [Streptomyces sp. NPDC057136]|uniref:Rv1733c family protein n=1 Tax=Streptomyces sp. NPDC057136 TaxID=3346029 RepID=UPI003643BA08